MKETATMAYPSVDPPADHADAARSTGPWAYRAQGVGVTLPSKNGPVTILEDVSFDVRPGEIVGIVGRSGTGKTTLLRVLGGLLAPTTGTLCVQGSDAGEESPAAITVFQDYVNALLPWRTVAQNVALPLEGKLDRRTRAERVAEALDLVDLGASADQYPWRLSGGMQQRVQIARALALHPKVLLMDEPFGALDAITKSALQDRVLDVHARTGATILFITHDLEEAIYLSDRVFVVAGAPGKGVPGGLVTQAETLLPRPRNQIETRELPAYLELRHQLVGWLGIGEARE